MRRERGGDEVLWCRGRCLAPPLAGSVWVGARGDGGSEWMPQLPALPSLLLVLPSHPITRPPSSLKAHCRCLVMVLLLATRAVLLLLLLFFLVEVDSDLAMMAHGRGRCL